MLLSSPRDLLNIINEKWWIWSIDVSIMLIFLVLVALMSYYTKIEVCDQWIKQRTS